MEKEEIYDIGVSIDNAINSESEILAAIRRAEKISTGIKEADDQALLAFFMSNAWGSLYDLRKDKYNNVWSWEQPELQKQICLLRIALTSSGFNVLNRIRRCQIYTNLGNALNTVGRVSEALEQWDRAIELIPKFGMALGNRALGLETYARGQYDPGHAWILWLNSIDAYDAALKSDVYFDSPGKDQIAKYRERAAAIAAPEVVRQSYAPDGYSLGRSKIEQTYRFWALQHRLFLHPLNDLGPISLAARDVLSQPSFVAPIAEPPTLISFFNQLKQEYASARWLVYTGMSAERPHFSDRGVLLQDTLDDPVYCLGVEQIKAGYRLAYSLFDKIAFFINFYWEIGCPEQKINFRTIWFRQQKFKKGLHPTFVNEKNLLLRGLYWISKDLFVHDMRETLEPEARDLANIRNHLEHKFLKVTNYFCYSNSGMNEYVKSSAPYVISKHDLQIKTLKVLKLSRSALLYLAFAMHAEEIQRNDKCKRIIQIKLPVMHH